MVRSAGVTAGLKVGSVGLAFVASLLYARTLGPHGYGQYAYVVACTSILTVPASLGLPQYILREGAKAPESLRRLCRWADMRILLSGGAAGLLLTGAVFIPQAADARWLFVVAAPLPLLNNLGNIRKSLVQAYGWAARSQWPALVLGPATMLGALIGLWLWQDTLYPIELMAAMTGTALIPLVANQFQLKRATSAKTVATQTSLRIRTALPFMWLGMLQLVNYRTDLIMLGTLNGGHDAGIYAVVSRAAGLIPFFLGATNNVLAPRVAKLYQAGDIHQLQRLLNASIRRVCLITVPLALIMIFASEPLLILLYGHAYADGSVALTILASAQLFDVCAGPTGMLMNMTGYEKLTAIAVSCSALLNIALNAILIPIYGINGAAVASGTSVVLWNILIVYWIRQHLGLKSSCFNL